MLLILKYLTKDMKENLRITNFMEKVYITFQHFKTIKENSRMVNFTEKGRFFTKMVTFTKDNFKMVRSKDKAAVIFIKMVMYTEVNG